MSSPPDTTRSLGLSVPQVAGSALAAVSGAFLASWLGVSGTIIGAAVGSVIGTVGTATYAHTLRRSTDVVRRTAGGLVPPLAVGQPVRLVRPLGSALDQPDESPAAPAAPGRQRWTRLALGTAAALAIGLGALTAVEGVTGKPVSALAGHGAGSGTTLGSALGAATGPPNGSPTPDQSRPGGAGARSPQPSDGASSQPTSPPSATPSGQPSATPSASPTDQPTQTPSPTGAPSPAPTTPSASSTPTPTPVP